MKKGQKHFLLYAATLMGIVIAVSQIFFSSIFVTKCFPGRIMSIVCVWMVTCASYYWMMKTVTEKPKAFSRIFMLQTTIKLLLYMTCIMIYLLLYKQHGVTFTIHFLVIYLVFAVFEVISILKLIQ